MGVPTSEVGYTIATTRRETTKVRKNMWWHWGKYIHTHITGYNKAGMDTDSLPWCKIVIYTLSDS